ncbi:hypothetical protein BDQ94DRAFT_140992 [Aspergillus welwitschiae]|uniref:Uncharacterized protein n=1 Tax=Aspergillus welwitschiae TaxID=1341132 RepID=A0A3F3Q6U9_9EURO|nr:hypothetical protein BDQ94DRAFT_140992 [Aspergillus welwitschiae]RDH34839.1 hypothetical protein BDQ94DRAFT_140992 [Aspergillus welwitschiae]
MFFLFNPFCFLTARHSHSHSHSHSRFCSFRQAVAVNPHCCSFPIIDGLISGSTIGATTRPGMMQLNQPSFLPY